MNKAICHLAVIPLRKLPSDTSEMISQILFGETFYIMKRKRSWVKIKCDYDGYEGWIDKKQLLEIDKNLKSHHVTFDMAQQAVNDNHFKVLLLGSTLPNYDGISFELSSKNKYTYSGKVVDTKKITVTGDHLVKIAKKYLHAPYLWGGRTPFGIDCSGFTQMVYKFAGIPLKRDAYLQIDQGDTIDFISEARAGDLAFFVNEEQRIHHVGILLNDNEIIHASGAVKIDKIDQEGIYSKSTKRYTHKLRLIKRFLD